MNDRRIKMTSDPGILFYFKNKIKCEDLFFKDFSKINY